MNKYTFHPYNPEYPNLFTQEKSKLSQALESLNPQLHIKHVGSTAIPNLGGKGILDILIGTSKNQITQAQKLLEQAGYEFRPTASTPHRKFFRIDYPYNNTIRRVHIHLTEHQGADWQEITIFKQFLLNNPDKVKEYEDLKKKAVAKAQGKGKIYRQIKQDFIQLALGVEKN